MGQNGSGLAIDKWSTSLLHLRRIDEWGSPDPGPRLGEYLQGEGRLSASTPPAVRYGVALVNLLGYFL